MRTANDVILKRLYENGSPIKWYAPLLDSKIEAMMEEYATIKVQEAQAKCTIPVVSGSLPLASGSVTKTREPLPTYHHKCDLCGEIFWTKDAFNNKCPECGREGWKNNDR